MSRTTYSSPRAPRPAAPYESAVAVGTTIGAALAKDFLVEIDALAVLAGSADEPDRGRS